MGGASEQGHELSVESGILAEERTLKDTETNATLVDRVPARDLHGVTRSPRGRAGRKVEGRHSTHVRKGLTPR